MNQWDIDSILKGLHLIGRVVLIKSHHITFKWLWKGAEFDIQPKSIVTNVAKIYPTVDLYKALVVRVNGIPLPTGRYALLLKSEEGFQSKVWLSVMVECETTNVMTLHKS